MTLRSVIETDLYDTTPDPVLSETKISLELYAGYNASIWEDMNGYLYDLGINTNARDEGN